MDGRISKAKFASVRSHPPRYISGSPNNMVGIVGFSHSKSAPFLINGLGLFYTYIYVGLCTELNRCGLIIYFSPRPTGHDGLSFSCPVPQLFID